MVETPAAAITVSHPEEPASKDEKEGLLETGPTITLVHQKPITSSIRGTIRHLVAEAGKLARFRGFRYHMIFALAYGWGSAIAEGVIPRFMPFRMVITAAGIGALTANLHAAWVHKVISMPSNATWWSRIPSRSSWKTLALPAAVSAAMPYVSLCISMLLVTVFGVQQEMEEGKLDNYNCAQWTSFVLRALAVVVISIACTLFLCLPAMVTQIRVAASLLPDDQDAIVPFDRTFGGKVVSKAVGGTGAVGFLDAWKSFNWEARWRLIKLFIKSTLLMVAFVVAIFHVLVLELFLIFGAQLGKALSQAKHNP